MHDSDGGNAMTEVALALAMAFFSISILALVSMGAGGATPQQVLEAALAQDTQETPKEDPADQATLAPPLYAFWWQGQWHDDKMQPMTNAMLQAADSPVLVFPADLPLETVMQARQRLEQHRQANKGPVAIAQMTPDWQQAFSQRP